LPNELPAHVAPFAPPHWPSVLTGRPVGAAVEVEVLVDVDEDVNDVDLDVDDVDVVMGLVDVVVLVDVAVGTWLVVPSVVAC
jgi:hypothetical protein